ncbi:MAG: type II toxin-antitoxin system HicA family toxin [Verrucomicrobia bacterium]|nr:type II toxin-antitoxin system HicA family toxin [Verrucomicrobiota bacterium]MCH8528375.1 type II toxin-antitoxin system HicA family toxin [Kiritimatiellia bacterium]
MTQIEKLQTRFLSKPKDFTWDELCKLLKNKGFQLLSGSGSRYKFVYDGPGKEVISLHKPHPGNIVKKYVLENVETKLREMSLL